MKNKILNFLLIITSLFGYLEWSGNNKTFLFQAESEILYKLFTNPSTIIHPFILLPLAGQLVLVITLFQKEPSKILTIIGITGLTILLGLMFFIGLISRNVKVMAFSTPFLIISAISVSQLIKRQSMENL